MTHAPTPLKLRATTAICAVLALGSTPAWAQDAAPVLDVPAAAAPTQKPTIVLPEAAPAMAPPAASTPTIVSEPQVQQVPTAPPPVAAVADEPAPARRVAERPVERSTVATRAAGATAPVAAAPIAPVQAAPADIAPAPAAPAAVTPDPVAPLPVDQPASRTVDVVDGESALGAGALATLLVALGLGGIVIAMRSRRRRHAPIDDTIYQTVPAQAYAPVAAPKPVLEPAAPLPAFATADEAIGQEELVTAPLRDGPVPQTRAERDALLDRMISAPPSAENPFTSRKARLRRARIILQSREIDERNNAAQPFDWRTYKPSASDPTPATPPRVTA